jgi:hypothetical protein
MEGASVGGMRTFHLTFRCLDLFLDIGGFSVMFLGDGESDLETAFNAAIAGQRRSPRGRPYRGSA